MRERKPVTDPIERDLRLLSLMNISKCGVREYPFVRLKNGLIFYSFPTNNNQLKFYKKHREYFPKEINEECVNVILNVVQYFIRENSGSWVMPKSYFINPGWGFVDAGTFMGFASMKAALKFGESIEIFAIEASKKAYDIMLKNITENGFDNIVHPIHAAACNFDGEVDFFEGAAQNNTIFNSLYDYYYKMDSGGRATSPIKTRALRIDSLLKEKGFDYKEKPLFISMEINGAEVAAVKGISDLLDNSKRFEMRIASRYTTPGEVHPSRKLEEIFSKYPDVICKEIEPYFHAFRY